MKFIYTYILFFFIAGNALFAQKGFQFYGNNSRKQQVSFKLINNLIVFPINVNGKKLSFILDTGVNKSILFSLSEIDSLALNNIEKVQLKGLGGGDYVDALLSRNNRIQIKNLISRNETIYVILRDQFDLSSRMGITIHGIIGNSLLKNVIVKINYKTKKLHFYNPTSYRYRKRRKRETLPLQFYRNKPYVDAQVQIDTIGTKKIPLKMLIDSGGSDALWLFEHSKEGIETPKRFFNDILGEGLSGTIYGNRSRIPEFYIGKFRINQPTVSFLDTLSTFNARGYKQRNGSIGGNILKRFKVWMDYPNKTITLQKNSFFKNDFNYNMSGLDVIYMGKTLVKELTSAEMNPSGKISNSETNVVSFVTSYAYTFKPSYKINRVVINSPAAKAGLLKGDVLLEINKQKVTNLTLNDIYALFQEKNNKIINLSIDRNGEILRYEFRLQKSV